MEITAKEAQRAYQRAWRKANRDKVREYEKRYWERKAETMRSDDEPKTRKRPTTRVERDATLSLIDQNHDLDDSLVLQRLDRALYCYKDGEIIECRDILAEIVTAIDEFIKWEDKKNA